METALVLPILLMVLVGTIWANQAMFERAELRDAAREAAIAGATEPSQPRRCDTALAVLAEVYGRDPDDARCIAAVGDRIEVSALINFPVVIPGLNVASWPISVTERAVAR